MTDPSAQDRERSLREEWNGATHLLGLVWRYPFVSTLLIVLCTGVGWLAAISRAPEFESSLYLGLGDPQASNPVLAGLDIPTGTLDTKDAYSVLRSQELLEMVVSGPDAGTESFRLDLTTDVEELAAGPWNAAASTGGSGSLRAHLIPAEGTSVDWAVRFDSENYVWIAPFSKVPSMPLRETVGLGPAAVGFAVQPGTEIELDHSRLMLTPYPGIGGRTFRIRSRTREQAIAKLRRNLVLQVPGERNQVLRLVVRDSQPGRARELAQAISDAFLRRDSEQTRGKAEEVVRYIDGELAARREELAQLETSIAEMRRSNPDWMAPETLEAELAARALELEQQIESLRVESAELDAAVSFLESTELPSVAVLRGNLRTPTSDRWLDQIDELDLKLSLGPDSGGDLRLVQRQEEYRRAHEKLRGEQRRLAELDAHLFAFRAGDETRLAALVQTLGNGDATAPQSLLESAVRPYEQALARFGKANEEYLEHPEVERAQRELVVRRGVLVGALDAALQGVQDRVAAQLEECNLIEADLVAWPEQDRQNLIDSRDRLWTKVRSLAVGKRNSAHRTLATLKQQRIDLETRRAALPAARTTLAAPELEAEGLRTLVHDLHKRRESAEVALAGLMPGARVLEPAGEPTPRGPFLWLLGILIGFGIGGVLALGLAEMRSRRKPGAPARRRRGERGPDEVQLPILARLGKDTLPEPLSWDMRGTAFAGLRRLRVQLGLMDRRSWNTSLLGIAGDAAASEGRESAAVTYGLALTHRLANRSVLIIDACGDGRGLTQDLELAGQPGLMQCLEGEAPWKPNLVTVGTSQVEVLPSGIAPGPESQDWYEHARWPELLEEAGRDFDVVLVQLPELPAEAEWEGLAARLGSVLLCAAPSSLRAGSEWRESLTRLRTRGARLAGVFLQGESESRSKAA